MRRIQLMLITLFIISNYCSYGQGNEITFDDLKSPTSPAFNIIGAEPKSVTRPTNRNGLSTTIINGFSSNLGLEFSPFWLQSNPTLTFKEYEESNLTLPNLWRTLGISLAKLNSNEDDKESFSKYGMGFRTQLIRGELTEKAKLKLQKLAFENVISTIIGTTIVNLENPALVNRQAIIETINTQIQVLINLPAGSINFPPASEQTVRNYLTNHALQDLTKLINNQAIVTADDTNSFLRKVQETAASKESAIAYQTEQKSRIGWILELSGASAYKAKKNSVDGGEFTKAGIWLALTNRGKSQDFEFTLLARYVASLQDSTSRDLDFGLSLTKSKKEFSLSIEAIYRNYEAEFDDVNINNEPITRVEKDNTYRLAANMEYKITDFASITVSLGKDYGKPFDTTGSFLAIWGLNFALPNSQKLNMN